MAQWTHIEGAHDTLLCSCVKSTGGLQRSKHHHVSVDMRAQDNLQALLQLMQCLTSSQISSRGFLQQQQPHI